MTEKTEHKDAGYKGFVYHADGQCIKCTCGEWVAPKDWERHIKGE